MNSSVEIANTARLVVANLVSCHAANACNIKQQKIQIPKNWNLSGNKKLKALKKNESSGMESENTIDELISRPYLGLSPGGNIQDEFLKNAQPK